MGQHTRCTRGMATVELALSLVGLTLATGMALWSVWVLGQQVRVVDTAREVARQVARGDDQAARQAAQRGPAGVTVTSTRQAGDAVVTARLQVRVFDPLPVVPLSATARVALEPGVQ